jgi:glycerol-1-phosphate dehydrogenase [NAD(P)+]
MEMRKVTIPFFLKIGGGLLAKMPEDLVRTFGSALRVILVTDAVVRELYADQVAERLRAENVMTTLVCVEENTHPEAERVSREAVAADGETVILGLGGGKVLDVAKMAAEKSDHPWVSVPTVISHDGICSPIAVMKDEWGKSQSLGARMPHGLIGDIEVIASSPVRTRRAGVGDLVSNLSALADWDLAHRHGKEEVDDFAYLLSNTAALSVLKSENKDVGDRFFLTELLNGLVLSGIAMEIAGTSRPCSGGEHEFSHALDALGTRALHGEQVAVGTILCSYLRGEDWLSYRKVFELVGLPVTAEGLKVDPESVIRALVNAPGTRPGRYTILEHVEIDETRAGEAAQKTGVI